MELTFAAATDVGRQRDHNEDNFLVDKKLRLFLVACTRARRQLHFLQYAQDWPKPMPGHSRSNYSR